MLSARIRPTACNITWSGYPSIANEYCEAPKESVSHAVNLMNGGTSRVIRSEFPELEEFLWGDSLWADGYFAESVGQVTEARMRTYIRNQ